MNLFVTNKDNNLTSAKLLTVSPIVIDGSIVHDHEIVCKVDHVFTIEHPGSVDLSTNGLHLGFIDGVLVCYWFSAKRPEMYILTLRGEEAIDENGTLRMQACSD